MSRRAAIEAAALVVVAAILGVLRVLGVKSPLFQAAAHLFVGGLTGAYILGRNRVHLGLALGLSVLELACFLLGVGSR